MKKIHLPHRFARLTNRISTINKQRDAQFSPDHLDLEESEAVSGSYSKLQPGLPEPTGQYKRKSEFEGAGNSYSSRAKGDRFSGLIDMEWLFGKK
jgi:hypothetical protein